jgi:hypothetical protein
MRSGGSRSLLGLRGVLIRWILFLSGRFSRGRGKSGRPCRSVRSPQGLRGSSCRLPRRPVLAPSALRPPRNARRCVPLPECRTSRFALLQLRATVTPWVPDIRALRMKCKNARNQQSVSPGKANIAGSEAHEPIIQTRVQVVETQVVVEKLVEVEVDRVIFPFPSFRLVSCFDNRTFSTV